MDITATRRDDMLVVRPTGRFDAHAVNDFRALLASTRRRERDEVAVDLNNVEFVDEQALSALADARTELRASNGDLVLASPSQSVRIILELTGRAADFATRASDDLGAGSERVLVGVS